MLRRPGRVEAPRVGVWTEFLYQCARLLARASAGRVRLIRYIFVAQPVPSAPAPMRQPTGSCVRPVAPEDPVVAEFPRPSGTIARRFRDGALCFAARSGERFAGFLWLMRGAYEEDQVRCRYEMTAPELSVWDFDVFVEPDFRLGRTFARLWGAANAHLSAEGVRWSLSRISAFNPGSIAAHARMGARTLHTATFLCIGRIQVSFFGAPPWFHVSLSPASRPVLRLAPPQ